MARKPSRMIERVLGSKADPIKAMLENVHPDLARYVQDFAYGEVYARPGLGLIERELLAVTCLTLLNLKPQLKTHVYGALNVGVTRLQLEETFIHIALYAGFPVALSGLLTAKEVFDELDRAETDRDAIDRAGPAKKPRARKKHA